ncbi:class I SAM-dependent methyltransferase [Alteraurantiacibacter aquimixticola]|nr:class I SAM-dependent methyltransferase [Alteraurantiacibacter aquimixticola]
MDKSQWQGVQGETWASEWRRTDRSFTAVTEKLLELTRGYAFEQVLDIGCGAGELSLAIARGRPGARVMGVDVSPALIEAAKERGSRRTNASFELADAAEWTAPEGFAPELLVSRHGVMFFDDPPSAFANLARNAADNANLLFSCFRTPAENPFFTKVVSLLPQPPAPPSPGSPGPFAFADRERMASILTDGRWTNIDIAPFDFAMVVGAGEDPVADAVTYFATIGPAAMAAREMSEADRQAFFERVRRLAVNHYVDGVVWLPAAGWIVTANKA